MKNKYLHRKWVMRIILFILLLGAVGMTKAMAQTSTYTPASAPIRDTVKAKTVGLIPYSEDFITQEEVMEWNYAITSFRMIDTATVAVLTGASDMILVYSFSQNQILRKIQLPIFARAFDYDNGLFHVIGDRTYLTIDAGGRIRERKDFKEPQLPNEEVFIISDLKIINGQPVIHECNANTYSITSDGLQKIDTFYYDHARNCKIHPKYIDENSLVVYSETPSKCRRSNVSMESLGLEGKLACLNPISVDNDFIAINLQTTYNCTGSFVKSYLLVINPNGELINLVEVPINFSSYISQPFCYKDNVWYYAFSGQEGISFFEIGTNTNRIDSPDSYELYGEGIDYSYYEPENETSCEDRSSTSGWRTITQTWYNGNQYRTLEWTPIAENIAYTCTWIEGTGYRSGNIKTPDYITTQPNETKMGVPYKKNGYTRWWDFESYALEGRKTGNCYYPGGNDVCDGDCYWDSSDAYVIGVDCSGYVTSCWEFSHTGTSNIPKYCTPHGDVVTASESDFQKGDALNWADHHVMLYTGHEASTHMIKVFESTGGSYFRTVSNKYDATYFGQQGRDYKIQRLNIMKNIILRLDGEIELIQNGTTVTNVTQGVPLTVRYNVTNAGTETWSGNVRLFIEQSTGAVVPLNPVYSATLDPEESRTFTFSNDGVSSDTGTSKFYVRVKNGSINGVNANDDGHYYDVGSLTNSNPLVFQIVGGGSQTYYNINASASPSAGGTVSGAGTYSEGSTCSLTATPNSGYTFVKWTKNGTQVSTNPTYSFMVTQSASYVAHFEAEAEPCYIRFALNDSYGDGWNGNYLVVNSSNGSSWQLTVEESYTSTQLLPIADQSHVSLTWIEGDYADECSFSVSYPNGNVIYEGSNLDESFSFGFDVDCDGMPSSYYTVTATASPNNGGSVTGGGSYLLGSTCTLTASPNTGYSFVRWTKNGSQVSTSASYSFTVTGNANYVAVFSQNSYTISASASPSAGGTVSGAGSYTYGSSCTLTASPNAGYSFVRWTKNGSQVSTNPTYSFTVTQSASYVAHFEADAASCPITFTLNDSYGDGWNGNYLVVNLPDGSSQQLTIANGSSATYTISIADQGHVTLSWIEGNYTDECSFSISYSNGNVIYEGSNLDESFSFGFDVDCDGMPSTNTYTISVSASPSNGGTVSGAGAYYEGSTCMLSATSNTGYIFERWTKNGVQVSTNPNYSFTVTESANYMANFTANNGSGILNGVFSVGENTQINFSQGDLQYQASTNTWRFATNQWDYVGADNANISQTYSGWTDLFGWGTSGWTSGNTYYHPWDSDKSDGSLYGPPGNYDLTGDYANADWGVYNAISNGGNQTNQWRTLTQSEWNYVFNTRTTVSGIRYAKANVNNVNGVILLPDDWSSDTYSLNNTNEKGASFSSNTITVTQWATLENAGAVFLPAAGYRNGTSAIHVGSRGSYWSASCSNSNDAYYVSFYDSSLGTNLSVDRCYGRSVRLVHVAENYSYEINVSASPIAGGTVSGAGNYTYGSSCTLTASPNTGYSFVRWTKNGSQVSTSASYSFTVTESATYVAVFEQSATTQSQTLTNGWNWWSSYIELNGVDGLTLLENSLGSAGLMIKSRSDGYVESYQYNGTTDWFGSLLSINNEQMYKINMNAGINMTLTGSLASTSNHPITISNGWNWIGFPQSQSVGVTDAMSGYSPAVNDILKGRNGYTTYFSYNGTTGWFGSLNTLEPGSGYMYQSQSSGTKTLVFQTGRSETLVANLTPENNVYQPLDQQFADNMIVTAVVEMEGEELRSDSHELAAFADGECRGSVRLLYVEPIDRYVAFLTVFGKQGDGLEFRLTDGMETQVSDDGLAFTSDGVEGTLSLPKVFHFGTLGVGETSSMVRIYPNPVHKGGELRFVLPMTSGTIKLEICNVLGVSVYRDDAFEITVSTAHLTLPASVVPGTYVLKATTHDGVVYYGKLVVD